MSVCTIVREGESVSVSGERERITEHRREQQSRAEHAAEQQQQSTQHAAEQRAAAAEQSTGAAMASRKHERSESR